MGPNSCPTCTIQTEPTEGNPTGKVLINESDFDEETMTKCEPDAPDAPVVAVAAGTETPAGGEATPPVAGTDAGTKIVAPWTV
jgi:hypothetical protein